MSDIVAIVHRKVPIKFSMVASNLLLRNVHAATCKINLLTFLNVAL